MRCLGIFDRGRALLAAGLAVLAVATVFGVVSADASAKTNFSIGISENQPRMFEDPLFTSLKVKFARVVVSYDVMTSKDDELGRVALYLAHARAAGVEPLVSFEHSRGGAEICKNKANRNRRQCKLPSAAKYEQSIRAFLLKFPWVKTISPWNEINHFTQPTFRNPRAAANFVKIVKRNCRDCKVVVADLLDAPDSTRSAKPKYKSTLRYIKQYRKALGSVKRDICGVHNYSDTNRFRSSGTRAIIDAIGCKQIWLTETGGIYKFGTFSASQPRQLRATKYMFKLAESNRKIKRLYIYTWFGAKPGARFDAGLVSANGKPRSAYKEVKKRVASAQASGY